MLPDMYEEDQARIAELEAERDELEAQLEAVREAWPAVMEMALQEWNANREEESIIPQSIQHIQYALNPGKDGG